MTESAKARNRQDFPFAASMIDALRKDFPEASVSYAEENGKFYGTRNRAKPIPIYYLIEEKNSDRSKCVRAGLPAPILQFMVI